MKTPRGNIVQAVYLCALSIIIAALEVSVPDSISFGARTLQTSLGVPAWATVGLLLWSAWYIAAPRTPSRALFGFLPEIAYAIAVMYGAFTGHITLTAILAVLYLARGEALGLLYIQEQAQREDLAKDFLLLQEQLAVNRRNTERITDKLNTLKRLNESRINQRPI